MSEKMASHFLNVDLDVHAKSGLEELVDAFAPAVFELGGESKVHKSFEVNSTYEEHFYTNGTFKQRSIDETILAFYNAVQALRPSARTAWESAESRCFNIGIQAGDHPHQTRYHLSQENIARLSSMKADVAITVYAPPKE